MPNSKTMANHNIHADKHLLISASSDFKDSKKGEDESRENAEFLINQNVVKVSGEHEVRRDKD